jgi:hypothetical protein
MNPYHLASFPGPAPLAGQSNSPLGAFDGRTEKQTYKESEHLRHPRDLVYHQRVGFDNACEMKGVTGYQSKPLSPSDSGHILNLGRSDCESTRVLMTAAETG